MSSKTKKTGLGGGVDAIFGSSAVEEQVEETTVDDTQKEAEEVAPEVEEPIMPPKYRTSVMLYPETLSDIELLKSESRKQGVKATMSDILNDAVELLAKERQIR